MSIKYELTSEAKIVNGVTLYRIKALRDFGPVKTGDLGGWIESEDNLSHEGDAWVSGNACVSGGAHVYENAQVFWNAQVSENAWVSENAQVYGDAWVSGNARVYGDAWVSGNARVYGDACVSGGAQVSGDAWVYGNARVFGNACVYGGARVFGNAWVLGNAWVYGNAQIQSRGDIIWFSGVGSELGTLTAYRSARGISVSRGCYTGTLEEFEAAVNTKHGNNIHAQMYSLLIQAIKLKFSNSF